MVKVGYNVGVGVVFIILGAVNLTLGLLLQASSGEFSPPILLGPLFLVLGVLQLVRPMFEYDPATRTIRTVALVGPVGKSFGGSAGGRLFVQDNRIMFTRPDGTTKRVPIQPFMAQREQYDRVVAHITHPS